MSYEIIIAGLALFTTVVINIVAIAFFAGQLKANQTHQKELIEVLKQSLKEDLTRLEKKQDKYNNLIERMVQVEASTKSAHKRIDEIGGGKK